MTLSIPRDRASQRSAAITLAIVAVSVFVVRVAAVTLWSVIGGNAVADNAWFEFSITIASDVVLLCIIGMTILYYANSSAPSVRYEFIAGSLTTYAVSALALLLLGALVPFAMDGDLPSNGLSVATGHLIALGTFAITIGLAGFLVFVLVSKPSRATRYLLMTQATLLMCIWMLTALSDVWNGFYITSIVLIVVGSFVMFLSIKRLKWLSTLSMDKKIRLLWITICAGFAAFVLMIQHAFLNESMVAMSAEMFIRSGSILPAVVNLYMLIFLTHLLFSILAAMPNSGIVDRRSSEVESLSQIAKLIAESATVEDLLVSITQFAQRVCRGHGAWCETYDADRVVVRAAHLINAEYIMTLHLDERIHRMIKHCDGPTLIDAVQDRRNGADNSYALRSLIAVPISNDNRRIGTLVTFSTVEFGFEDDDVRLLTAFADTIAIALEQARLADASAEQDRMRREFEVARRIQMSLLPRSAPTLLGFDVDAVMIPALEVGGDYFDYIRFQSGRSGVIIADVAGKGIPAALYMATLKGVVLSAMRTANGPADLLRSVNTTLTGTMERSTFITMSCVEFDAERSSLRFARAGHTPAILRNAHGVHVVSPQGMAIGIVDAAVFDAKIIEEVIAVAPGDVCLLTTDGVTERRDTNRQELHTEGITTMLADANCPSASSVVAATLELLRSHANGAEPHDDITIVAIVINEESQKTNHQHIMHASQELDS